MNEAEHAEMLLSQKNAAEGTSAAESVLQAAVDCQIADTSESVHTKATVQKSISPDHHIELDWNESRSESKKTRPALRDWAKVVQLSSRFSEVSTEQLERVKIMHDRFAEGAEFSFNYNTLLVVASILAGLGLVSNSAATIIASMLVSPIMVCMHARFDW